MNSARTDIDSWFIEGALAADENTLPEIWDPIFDPDRHLVHTKIGPYWRLFLRPEGFVKRFYHRVYPLPIENWQLAQHISLYDDFCSIDVTLEIRFQVSLKYALSNMDILPELNGHIKNTYQEVLINLIDKELLSLADGSWVLKSVTEIEQRISLAISELLIMQNIQSQTLCRLKPAFKEFPEVQLAQERAYLCVLKKSFEFNEAKREELFHQEQAFEQQQLEHKQQQLEQLNHDAELKRLKQAQDAKHKKRLLEEQEQQQSAQFAIEQRLHAEKVKHENRLKAITLEAELELQHQQETRLRVAEQQTHAELLAHQTKLKEQELEADIAKHELQQARWRESRDKLHAEQVAYEQRQKQLEFDADVDNKKRQEQQRLEMQKESYDNRKEADVYLRREIELLELEKQRMELQLAIKEAKKQDDSANLG